MFFAHDSHPHTEISQAAEHWYADPITAGVLISLAIIGIIYTAMQLRRKKQPVENKEEE